MVALPAPRITQAGTNFLTGQSLGRQQGFQDQDRQTMLNAGELAASGDLPGASNALFKGGQFDKGLATKNAIAKMSADRLDQALKVQDRIARVAGTIETPEQFELAKKRFKALGLPVPEGLTFEMLPQIKAEALSVVDQMTLALREKKMQQDALEAQRGKLGPGWQWTPEGTARRIPGTEEGAQPKLAADYRWAEDGKTAEPIPGTKPWQEQQEAGRKGALRREQQQGAARTVVEDVDRALNVLDTALTTAPTRWMGSFISGTPAAELQAHIDSVGSNVGIDQLQKMRDSSPTGGALGQVPFQQQKRLEQLLGSIDISQPQHVLQDNLKRIGNLYLEILHGSEEELIQKYGEQEGRERHAKIPFYDVGFRNRLPDRTPTFGREGAGAPQQAPQQQPNVTPPAPAVQFLQQNSSPEIIEQFNRKYGPGAAERILGNQPSMTGVSP